MTAAASRKTLYRLLPDWLFGAFCLAIPALYNSYPLVTSDSGAYIRSGYNLQMPIDRPLAYSILLRITSMGITLWGVVVMQVLIVSVLLMVIARYFLGPAYRSSTFAAIMLLAGTVTSAGWFAGQVMPDIFTAILLMAGLILSIIPLSRAGRWALYVMMLGCILMHNSNLLIALLMGTALFLYCLRRKGSSLRRTAVALLATSVIGWVTLSSMNAIADRGFRPSAASHVFLMSRMVESGIMDDFLDDYCPADSAAYKLCAFRDKLPRRQWDFMWDMSGPLYTTGGWQANEEEYNRIIRKTLTTPKYLALHTVKAAQATLRQLPLIYVGDGLQQFDTVSSPHKEIFAHLKGELKEFHSSAQQVDTLHLPWWNALIVLFSLATIVSALLLRTPPRAPETAAFRLALWFCLLFLLINAAVTATLATVIARYEARVFWILPFLSILYIVRSFHRRDEPVAY